MKKFLLFSLLLLMLACSHKEKTPRAPGTYTAASCSQSDVNAVINGPTHTAVDGDVVVIPGQACTWSTGIVVPKGIGITITGTGTPGNAASTIGASSSCGATNITVSGGIIAFKMQPSYGGNSTSRLSCMKMTAGGNGSGAAFTVKGTCTADECPNLRVDNITFDNWAGHTGQGMSYGISAVDDMFGVLDHNSINGVSGNYLQLVQQNHGSYLGVGKWGDNSWAQPENYGSGNFLFFENNDFVNAGVTENEGNAGGYESQGGGRVVARFNAFYIKDNFNAALLWHGTESGGRPRSGRAWEFYLNDWKCETGLGCPAVVGARGGTGLTWGNSIKSINNSSVTTLLGLNTYRTQASIGGWGACDGSSPNDANDGQTYYTGTVASVQNSNVITVTGNPAWPNNKWTQTGAPYSVHDVTKKTGSEITANGSNTLTIAYGGGPGAWVPSNGDQIQILRATACIDQAGGRGQGALLSGDYPPPIPVNQVLSPAYLWLNSASGGAQPKTWSNTGRVIPNRDWYMEPINQQEQSSTSAPFNGSSAMGHGAYSKIPTSCTKGVGYWATDKGNWNQSGSGQQGQLYLCTATNTWTLFYTPYPYPHPLVSGQPPPPGGGGETPPGGGGETPPPTGGGGCAVTAVQVSSQPIEREGTMRWDVSVPAAVPGKDVAVVNLDPSKPTPGDQYVISAGIVSQNTVQVTIYNSGPKVTFPATPLLIGICH